VTATPPLHPDLAPLAFLVGTWTGRGTAVYPTTGSTDYDETVVVTHAGKPVLLYEQRTTRVDDGFPLHGERGYWRLPATGRVEFLVAHPTGHVEVEYGSVSGTTVELASSAVVGTESAKDVEAITRRIEVDGDVMRYTLSMAAVGQPMAAHLEAELRRT
jgi:hypothetical protein